MDNSCVLCPKIRNSKGEFVDSILFTDLSNILSDREKTKRFYNIATNEEFLNSEEVQENAKFDKNGQITAHSFLKLSKLLDSTDAEIAALEKKYSITAPYSDVIKNVENFNKNEDTSDFVPSLEEMVDEGLVKLKVVRRDEQSTLKLQETIENNELLRVIRDNLKSLGVAYDFVGQTSYNGRFSTKNAQKLADGYYHLIEISNGSEVDSTLVEEAAHLAVHSMKDSAIINRLLNSINEHSIHRLFTDEEISNANLSKNAKLELAGLLVKKMMLGKEPSGFSMFFDRVKNAIFSIFKRANLTKFMSDRSLATAYAREVALGFIFNPNEFSLDKALSNPVTLYSANLSAESKLLKDTLDKIGIMSTKLRNASYQIYKNYDGLTYRQKLKDNDLESLDEDLAASHVASCLGEMSSRLKSLVTIFENEKATKLDKMFDGSDNIELINYLFEAVELNNTLQSLLKIAEEYYENSDNTTASLTVYNAIKELRKFMAGDASGSINARLLEIERLLTASFMESALGAKSVRQAARVALSGGKLTPIDERIYTFKGTTTGNVTNIVSHNASEFNGMFLNSKTLEGFISAIRTYSNAKDVTVQILNKALTKVRINQVRKYNEAVAELREIEANYKGKVEDLFERYSNGTLTGNFISQYNLAQIEFEKTNLIKKIKDKFIKGLEASGELEIFKKFPSDKKIMYFEAYKEADAEWKAWIAEAYLDYPNRIYNTSGRYRNANYDALVSGKNGANFLETLNRLKSFKERIDKECLTEYITVQGNKQAAKEHFVKDRVPQYESSTVLSFKRKYRGTTSQYDSFQLYNPDIDYVRNLTAADFGSEATDVEPEFSDPYTDVRNEMKKIPLSGIKLREDMSKLSTDIFSSLQLYASMAYRFSTIQGVYSQVEIAIDTLNKRAGDNNGISANQYSKLEDKFLYNTAKFKPWENALRKIGSFTGLRLLGFSIRGARKNLGAGYLLCFQDATTGVAPFDLNDLAYVTGKNTFNLKHKAGVVGELVSGYESNDKWTNLMKRWDGKRQATPDDKHFKKQGFWSLRHAINIWMSGYSITDNKVMGIIYGSSFHNKVLFDYTSWKEINALDMYYYDNHNIPHIKNHILKSKNDATYYGKLKNALDALSDYDYNTQYIAEIEALQDLDDFTKDPRFAYDEFDIDLMSLNTIGTEDLVNSLKSKIQAEMDKLTFNEDNEFDMLYKINDYVVSSQGVFGSLNAVEVQSMAYMESFGRIKGYIFSNIQRMLLSNSTINSEDYKNAMFAAELTAIWAVFCSHKPLKISKEDSKHLRRCALIAIFNPFAMHNKETRAFLRRIGWSEDLFNKVCSMAMGIYLLIAIRALATLIFGRGNKKKYAERNYRRDAGNLSRLPLVEEGLLFKMLNENYFNLLTYDEDKAKRAIKNFDANKKENRDFYEDLAYWKNITYGDPNDPWGDNNIVYWLLGQEYSYLKGVASENMVRLNPLYFASDTKQLLNPVVESGFFSRIGSLINNTFFTQSIPEDDSYWDSVKRGLGKEGRKEANFLLRKVGLSLVEDEVDEKTGEVYSYKIVPLDMYRYQDVIDLMEERRTK